MIIPSDDEFLDAGAVVVRDDESGQGKVDFGTATGGVVSLWWDEDARSSEIVWREGGGDERARIEWSDVEQVRLTALKDGVQVALVIPATSPAAALTVRVDPSGVRFWSALPSSGALDG